MTTRRGSRGKEERNKTCTSRGSHNRYTINFKRHKQHRLGMNRSRTRPEEVIPEKATCDITVRAKDTRAFK